MTTKKESCARLYKMHFNGLAEADGVTPLKSFQILPVNSSCPIEGAIYDPSNKVLVIKTKTVQENLQMAPKLDASGRGLRVKGLGGAATEAKERVKILNILENRLTEREDILDYVTALTGMDKFSDGTTLIEQLEKLDNYTIVKQQ